MTRVWIDEHNQTRLVFPWSDPDPTPPAGIPRPLPGPPTVPPDLSLLATGDLVELLDLLELSPIDNDSQHDELHRVHRELHRRMKRSMRERWSCDDERSAR